MKPRTARCDAALSGLVWKAEEPPQGPFFQTDVQHQLLYLFLYSNPQGISEKFPSDGHEDTCTFRMERDSLLCSTAWTPKGEMLPGEQFIGAGKSQLLHHLNCSVHDPSPSAQALVLTWDCSKPVQLPKKWNIIPFVFSSPPTSSSYLLPTVTRWISQPRSSWGPLPQQGKQWTAWTRPTWGAAAQAAELLLAIPEPLQLLWAAPHCILREPWMTSFSHCEFIQPPFHQSQSQMR